MSGKKTYAYTLPETVDRMTQSALSVRAVFEIWWALEGEETRPRYIQAMNRHAEFFGFTETALLESIIVGLHRFFDKEPKTLSFPTLRERLTAEGVDPQAIQRFDELVAGLGAVASRVETIRHTVFAHRSAGLAYDDAFKKAGVTNNEVSDLTLAVLEPLSVVREALGMERAEHPRTAGRVTLRMLEKLRGPYDDDAGAPAPR